VRWKGNPVTSRLALFALVLSLPLSAIPAYSSEVVLVRDPAQDTQSEAVEGVKDILPQVAVHTLQEGAGPLSSGDVVLALGDQAAQAQDSTSASLICALLTDPDLKISRSCVRVSPLPDAFFLMSKIRDLVPNLKTLAAFNSHGHYKAYIKYLNGAGFVMSISVVGQGVDSANDLLGALRSLPGKAQALWLTPEPELLKTENFKLIAAFCSANRIALIAPVAVLAKTGALAGIAPDMRELGRAAGQAAKDLAAGKSVGATVTSQKCEVLVSAGTAAALNIKLDAGSGTLVP
jgi:ABC-type uncharacterized transport system substrate-binding protein